MDTNNHRWRYFFNGMMQAVTCTCALLVVVPLCLVFYHVFKSGLGAVNWAFFTQLPKPVGEPAEEWPTPLSALSSCWDWPRSSVCRSVCLGGISSRNMVPGLNWWIRFGADVLNGVPSIIWGMVA